MNTLEKIFSLTNTTDKKNKVITLCGVKLKIKKDKLPKTKTQLQREITSLKEQVIKLNMFKEEQLIRRNYEHVLKRLQKECKHRKINVVFLCNSNAKFSYTSLYKEFENNNNFNVKVLVTATTGHLNNQYLKYQAFWGLN